MNNKIAFLGGGNMAEALIKGILASGTAKPEQLIVNDVSSDRLEHLKKTYGILIEKSTKDAAAAAEIILLCVKPQVIDMVLSKIGTVADSGKLVISIAAGVTIARIEKMLPAGPRVVRVMPNTPALVLAGAAGVAAGTKATESDLALVQQIFGAIGRSVVVEEKLMDAVTGLSGSGPAYVFMIIDALSDAGVKAGLAPAPGPGARGPDRVRLRQDGARDQGASRQTARHGHLARAAPPSRGCTRSKRESSGQRS